MKENGAGTIDVTLEQYHWKTPEDLCRFFEEEHKQGLRSTAIFAPIKRGNYVVLLFATTHIGDGRPLALRGFPIPLRLWETWKKVTP